MTRTVARPKRRLLATAPRRSLLLLLLAIGASTGTAAPAPAASPPASAGEAVSGATDPGPMPTMPGRSALRLEIERKRETLGAEFDALRGKLEAAADSRRSADRDSLLDEVSLLRRIERVLGQQAAVAQLWDEAEAERRQIEERRRQGLGALPESPPFSFLLLDRLQDDLDAESSRMQSLDAGVAAATQALQQARDAELAAERARRAAQEALETAGAGQRRDELETRARLAQLANQAASEEVTLRQLEREAQKVERASSEVRARLLGEQVDRVAAEARLTRKELEERLVDVEREEFAAAETLEQVRRAMAEPVGSGSTELERLRRQTLQLRIANANQRLQHLGDVKRLWGRRYALSSGAVGSGELLPAWGDEARAAVEGIAAEERSHLARVTDLRAGGVVAGLGGETLEPRSPEVQAAIEERIRVHEVALAQLAAVRRAHERLLRQIGALERSQPVADRVLRARQMLRRAWDYEIVAVQDRPITVSKIVLGLVLFVAGIYVAGLASRFLGRRVWPRLGLDAGASAALQSLSYYLLVAALALFSLQVVNVPLTLFTFVGGALAIGVGFGSQNIVNNFISGLILLAERPIKVGDLVEMGDMRGNVERIGARSTRVRSYQNIHVIVPNSHFLEKEVVNWTLSDDSVRTSVTVGVSYGSPTDEVRRILVDSVSGHERICATPEPTVLFKDFGDSSLVFEVHFWVRIRSSMEKWMIESDVRFRVDQAFRRAGVVIAFPQRDVHLETRGPLEVHVRRGASRRPGGGEDRGEPVSPTADGSPSRPS